MSKRWQIVNQRGWPDITDLHISRHSNFWIARTSHAVEEMSLYNMTIEAVDKFLIRCGRYLTRLAIVSTEIDGSCEIMQKISKHCNNIEKLIVYFEYYPKKVMDGFSRKCLNLRYLELNNLDADFAGEWLVRLPKNIIQDIQLTGTPDSMENRKFRRLARCALEVIFFFCILSVIFHLILYIFYSNQAITKFSNLHTIKLRRFSFKLRSVKSLIENQAVKHVSLLHCDVDNSIYLLSSFTNLQELNLCHSIAVTDIFLILLARKCTQLVLLNIGCKY